GIGAGLPQHPLRFGRAEGVEDLEPEPERARERHRALEPRRGFGMKKAAGLAIERLAGEIALRRIGKLDGNVVACGSDLDERHARRQKVRQRTSSSTTGRPRRRAW